MLLFRGYVALCIVVVLCCPVIWLMSLFSLGPQPACLIICNGGGPRLGSVYIEITDLELRIQEPWNPEWIIVWCQSTGLTFAWVLTFKPLEGNDDVIHNYGDLVGSMEWAQGLTACVYFNELSPIPQEGFCVTSDDKHCHGTITAHFCTRGSGQWPFVPRHLERETRTEGKKFT